MSKIEAAKPQQTQSKDLSAPPLFGVDVPERNAQKLVALLGAKYCLGDKGSLMTSAALDKIQMTPLSAQRLVAYLRYTTFEIEEWIAANDSSADTTSKR